MSQPKHNQAVPISDCSRKDEASCPNIDLDVSLQSLKDAGEETAAQTQSKNMKIDKVPPILREMYKDFEKIFEPRMVSAGPYHHGKPALKVADKSKLAMANKFINEMEKKPEETGTKAKEMYEKILKEIQTLRECYEEEAIRKYNDQTLAWMLFVDGCALLQFIHCCIEHEKFREMPYKPYHISFINQDLLLLENQLPFRVLELLTGENFIKNRGEWMKRIDRFVDSQIVNPSGRKLNKGSASSSQPPQQSSDVTNIMRRGMGKALPTSTSALEEAKQKTMERTEPPRHLLELLRTKFLGKHTESKVVQSLTSDFLYYLKKFRKSLKKLITSGKSDCSEHTEEEGIEFDGHSYRNVNELTEAGVVLKASDTNRMLDINFTPHLIRSELHLPPIIIDDSIKAKLLNLIAYEMSFNASTNSEVTSYVCFLDSLIDHPQDVKELRDAKIIYNSLGSDDEVAQLFNEIAKDLVPNSEVYRKVQDLIQEHYDMKSKTWMAQVLHQHFSTPWTVIAFIGAIVAIIISFVQTYYTIFPRPGDCDPLCKYIDKTLKIK